MPSPSQPPVEARIEPETLRVPAAAERPMQSEDARAARRAGSRWRGVSRWLGLLCFALGVGLLVTVFVQAFDSLQRLSQLGALNRDFNSIAGQSKDVGAVVQAAVSVFGAELLRVLYLVVTGFVASAIAARGIGFFAASQSVIDEAVVAEG